MYLCAFDYANNSLLLKINQSNGGNVCQQKDNPKRN